MSENRPADDHPSDVPDLSDFRRTVLDLGIVAPQELDALAAEIPESAGVPGLACVLHEAGRLTGYQAAAIEQGKGRDLLVGDYLILEKLGAGAIGIVSHRARHRRLGRDVAIMILPPRFVTDRPAALRFRREAEAIGRLKHPNVAAVIEAGEDRGVCFLVTEYIDGSDLSEVTRNRGPLTVAEVLDHIIQAARGLDAAHSLGIVHGDVKPSNLMLDSSGAVRVLDLGMSQIMDEGSPSGPGSPESGSFLVTVDFMAPEQADDSRQVDHRADIYSLGCTLHYLLTGRAPFSGGTLAERLRAQMERPAPSLKAARPDVPISLEEVFQRMMAKSPAERPASMTEVIALLEECRSAAAGAGPPPTSAASEPSRKPTAFDEVGTRRNVAARGADRDAAAFARRTEADALEIGPELTIEDSTTNSPTEAMLAAPAIPTIRPGTRPRAEPAAAVGPDRIAPVRRINLAVQAAVVLLIIGFAGMLVVASRRGSNPPKADAELRTTPETRGPAIATGPARGESPPPSEVPSSRMVTRTIFDGESPDGWMLTNRRRLDRRHIQPDGLNPHGTGSYLVVYREKLGDFVLDFDYKLSPGGNSGVFLRVGDLSDPVNTGIEVELSDSTGTTDHDPGAFNGLVAPGRNAQKPAGQWNHMTITANGPRIAVRLNDEEVSSINLDQWTLAGKRPDGSPHRFKGMAIANLPHTGYIGFQDLKGDCWFRRIVLKAPARVSSGTAIPGRASAGPSGAPLVLLERSPGNG